MDNCAATLERNGVRTTPLVPPQQSMPEAHETDFPSDGHGTAKFDRTTHSSCPVVCAGVLRWGTGRRIPADVVLAADVAYDPDLIPALVEQLVLQLQAGCVAYIASAERIAATLTTFVDCCQRSGLEVAEIARFRACADAENVPLGPRLSSGSCQSHSCPQAGSLKVAEKHGGVRLQHCFAMEHDPAPLVLHCMRLAD